MAVATASWSATDATNIMNPKDSLAALHRAWNSAGWIDTAQRHPLLCNYADRPWPGAIAGVEPAFW